MYKGYWPNGIAIYVGMREGSFHHMFTTTSCDSLEEAKKVIEFWDDNENYILICSWIQHGWDKRNVCFKEYYRNVQDLEWGGTHVVDIPDCLLPERRRHHG